MVQPLPASPTSKWHSPQLTSILFQLTASSFPLRACYFPLSKMLFSQKLQQRLSSIHTSSLNLNVTSIHEAFFSSLNIILYNSLKKKKISVKLLKKFLFIWLCQVLDEARGIFSCGIQDLLVMACELFSRGMWNLFLQPGITPCIGSLES